LPVDIYGSIMANILTVSLQQAAQGGKMRDLFIEAYKPFIAATVCRVCGKYKTWGIDEELSIGLMAFNEAIDKFDGRGKFLSFSKLVIKSRLYDYFRYVKRRGESESLYGEDGRESQSVVDISFDERLKDTQRNELNEELQLFNQELSTKNITIKDLVKSSPKHIKKRKAVNDVIKFMLSSKECLEFFKASGNLPLKIIEDNLNISRKLIEPYRKYIISALIIYNGNYTYLKEYIK
jgi:RNA polymerase sigma factor